MALGENILKLRKKQGLSQEQLGEKIDVTRQTISNWELGETAPNPVQLKRLAKVFQVSIDELLDNDTKEILMKKVNNTEKLAGMIMKIIKIIGILLLVYLAFLVVAIVGLIIYARTQKSTSHLTTTTTVLCTLEETQYQIELGQESYFACDTCSPEMTNKIKSFIDFQDITKSLDSIEQYFLSQDGSCHDES